MPRSMTQEQKDSIIAQKIATPDGRAQLGQTI